MPNKETSLIGVFMTFRQYASLLKYTAYLDVRYRAYQLPRCEL